MEKALRSIETHWKAMTRIENALNKRWTTFKPLKSIMEHTEQHWSTIQDAMYKHWTHTHTHTQENRWKTLTRIGQLWDILKTHWTRIVNALNNNCKSIAHTWTTNVQVLNTNWKLYDCITNHGTDMNNNYLKTYLSMYCKRIEHFVKAL